MPTRRDVLRGTIAAAAFLQTAAGEARPSQPRTKVRFDVPEGACDCHPHIHGDPALFPFSPSRVYTPETALPEEMAALHKALGIRRVVIVTPSVYGTDNSSTVYGMKARGADARGVAVIDEKTAESELDAMDRAGIRGIRINLATGGVNDPEVGRRRLKDAFDRIAGRRWHVQMFVALPMVAGLKELIATAPAPVVFDHFAGAVAEKGTDQPGFSDLIELVRTGRAYVKVSGAYRISKKEPDYPDAAPLAKALIAANPDRILWGTDWPHPNSVTPAGKKPTEVTPLLSLDDGILLNLLADWAPDASIRRKILVDNPARLYGF